MLCHQYHTLCLLESQGHQQTTRSMLLVTMRLKLRVFYELSQRIIAKRKRKADTFYVQMSNSFSLKGPNVVRTCLSRIGKRSKERMTSSVVTFSIRSTSSSTLSRRPSVTRSLARERIRAKVDSLLKTRLLIHLSLARRSSSS